ncbi:MAG: CcmD family protein [Chlorobiales bacterium]|jgi:CcmD family protein|nr:CcmD family protein [Chlorobiales bacterium]
MLDFLSHNPVYIVLTVVLIIWTGIFTYLFRLDGKINRLEKALLNLNSAKPPSQK